MYFHSLLSFLSIDNKADFAVTHYTLVIYLLMPNKGNISVLNNFPKSNKNLCKFTYIINTTHYTL